ncbi:TetR/AcrR family transcriptional regulator [Planomonospora venezuelensis]|uniref:AcrR family transcriptional regulator n=1 Tax=Planomonospora venezuelensis TaxID=1999 RepID=A0A841DH82_PLAVE|nr:TetR/AcrR family transcriptional regulator [Planomonospora venezuelensis]MBB5966536.1 AcrR family transcriptional regulator [Planomonospora venezuelensis]GIN02286.1 TetR family transcriptional regulator [Planomonospora venezuelensis]
MPDPRRDARRDVRRANRGPSAAAENRAALIAAAREVFASDGYEAPLTSITRAARVGQGSLYRHFPDRVSLALAVFEDGVKELESLAAEPGTTLDDMLALMTEQMIASTAFVDMVSAFPADPRILRVGDRVTELLDGLLAQARQAGRIRADVTAGDLMLAIGMVAGILAKKPAAARRETAGLAWRLLRAGIGA